MVVYWFEAGLVGLPCYLSSRRLLTMDRACRLSGLGKAI